MMQDIIVKGHKIGNKKTMICVPITEKREEEIKSTMAYAINQGAAMLEWRMDWYNGIMDMDRLQHLLDEVAGITEKVILLCTFRSEVQGGAKQIAVEQYVRLLELVAKSKKADMVDLEYYQVKEPAAIIERLKAFDTRVIASHHEFTKTPSVEEMKKCLLQMYLAKADISKLAVMPQKKQDTLRLLEAVLEVKEEAPDSHIAAMAMGTMGVLSRMAGEWFGSEITFAALGKASAPGQISFDGARELLNNIHQSLGE